MREVQETSEPLDVSASAAWPSACWGSGLETPSRKPVTTEGGRIRPPMRLRGEANVGGVPPEPTGGSGTCRTGPEHVAPITGYGAKAPVGFPCWMSRSTPACHIGKERPIRGACRRASPQPIRRSGAALDYPTAHPHAPRSLTRRDRAEASRRASPVRRRARVWKRTFRSVFPAKAGIQSSWERKLEAQLPNTPYCPHWTPAFAGDAVGSHDAKTGKLPPPKPALTTLARLLLKA
jgi:hypothetical protein